jgi:hypothetical protein
MLHLICSLQAVHDSYIPALAYVVSGKQQRRHLLLGECGLGCWAKHWLAEQHCA